MQAKAFNSQVFLEILCNLVFTWLIIYLLKSGNYLFYVTPRMEPYLIFSAILSTIWAAAGLRRLFKPQHLIRSAHCFVLVIPVLFLLLPHSTLNVTDVAAGYAGAGAFVQNSAGSSTPKQSPSTDPNSGYSSDSYSDTKDDGENTSSLPIAESPYNQGIPEGLDEENKKITIGADDFYPWIIEIYSNIDKYEGYTITMTGFVFMDQEYLSENEFVPARLAMVCCAADLAPMGILCKYDKVSELESEQWVTVEGVLHKGQYNGQDEPQVTVTKITPAEEVRGYIFPY